MRFSFRDIANNFTDIQTFANLDIYFDMKCDRQKVIEKKKTETVKLELFDFI